MKSKKHNPLIEIMKSCGFFKAGYLLFILIWFISCIIDLVQNVVIGLSVDLMGDQLDTFIMMISICIGCAVYSFLFSFMHPYLMNRYIEKRMCRIRVIVGEHLLRVPYVEIENMQRGDIISRTMGDLENIQHFFENTLANFFIDSFETVVGLTISFIVNWKLTLSILIMIPIIALLNALTAKSIGGMLLHQKEQTGLGNGIAMNILQQISSVKAFNLEMILSKKYFAQLSETQKTENKIAYIRAKLSSVQSLSNVLIYLTMMVAGGLLIMNDGITAGEFVIILMMMNATSRIASRIQGTIYDIKECTAGAVRLLEILQLRDETESSGDTASQTEPRKTSDSSRLIPGNSMIKVDNVSFSYKVAGSNEKPVLKNISLNISKGQKIALVGSSGCGKSTLIKLLSALYLPTAGTITVDGINLSPESIERIREKIAVVTQENYLFPISIKENLLCGKPDATMEEITEAAKQAGIHEFISSLPDGYDTLIDESGSTISGGQKQRICIARAYIRKPEILVLDEPTAALDAEMERKVEESMAVLMEGKTTITIAHRLSTIRNSDIIYCMNSGEIVEAGTHEELYDMKGAYYELYKLQEAADAEGKGELL